MMSYKNDSILTIVNRYGKAEGACKSELYETYDRIRELSIGGNALGGTGMVPFNSFLTNIARMFGSPAFSPMLGSEALTIPGTSYYSPLSGGTGIVPGGQAAFGLSTFSNYPGIPTGGAAMLDSAASNSFLGSLSNALGRFAGFATSGIGANNSSLALGSNWDTSGLVGGAASLEAVSPLEGGIVGGAGIMDATAYLNASTQGAGLIGGAASAAVGTAAGMGFGRNWAMPAASLLSGIGGLMTTLGPLFGPAGLVGVATGNILNGVAGTVLAGFQRVNQRVLGNADIVLEEKVRNLETTMKMLDTQSTLLRKMLKDSQDGDKKALDNL